ncbi:alpha/beta fold hydrolase [Ilumatobacter nonamiensis]|uniref:alpha/beta fold hydrolase n=1 Tax=Ilumatobacter nonamiensis TaxID=467093 RepID=UPI00034742C0|nr:alpha/beta fold hydrolase [Ilumatobacter nonamiensis]
MKSARSFLVAGALVLAACTGSDRGEPPPQTREIVDEASAVEDTDDVFTPSDASGESSGDAPSATSDADDSRSDDADTATVDADSVDPVEPAGPDSEESSGDDSASGSSATPEQLDYSIVFDDLGGGVDGGWLTVPVDYDDPQGDTLKLWVTRHRASSEDDRIGVLFTNNGGPGMPASSMPLNARAYFHDPLVDAFDIVAWDPRGTGVSGGSADCIGDDEYDRYFAEADLSPETDAERDALVELAQDYADSCVDAVGDLLPHIGTNNTARDMDAIRQALGEEQVSYLGFSYGSELGAVWATLFPHTVRAAVLDGAAHPDAESLEPAKRQQAGFERSFNTFLEECSATPSCAFHNDGDAEGAYDRLLEELDENPVPGADDRPLVNQSVLTGAVIQAMYSDRRWPALERSLADAQNGDGAGLLALFDGYYRRDPQDGSYGNLIESLYAITCADEPDRLTVEEADRRAAELIGNAPRVFPETTGSYTCDFFPPSADPRAEITGEGAGPILVIGTTGDPTTPIDSSVAMADALEEGVFVEVEANQHLAYGQTDDCIDDIVHEYLIWLEPPPAGTVCS